MGLIVEDKPTEFSCTYRNPNPLERPGFRDILLSLMEDEQTVLSIPKDIESNSLTAVLGAPLEAGFNMLQTMYYNREITSSLQINFQSK